MSAQNLLVELLVEELPPKSLEALGLAFANELAIRLKDQGLMSNDPIEIGKNVKPFASPRRLGVWIQDISAQAADKLVENKNTSLCMTTGSSAKKSNFLYSGKSNFLYFPKLNVCGKVISIPRPTFLKKWV
jgi:glycyl-tRNA synthetase beta chain